MGSSLITVNDDELLRVLAVIDSLAPDGAQQSLADMAPHLRSLGVELGVTYFHERDGVAAALGSAGAELFPVGGTSRRRWFTSAVADIRRWQPHLVHTTLYEADVLGRTAAAIARRPVVTSLVNDGYGAGHLGHGVHKAKVRAAQAVDVATARLARRFHAVTETVADSMAGRLRVPRSRIDVVARGRDPDRLGQRSVDRARAVRERLGLTDGPLVVAAGRQEPQKGFDLLVQAFADLRPEIPTVTALIAGREGTATLSLRHQIAEAGLGDGLRLLGHRDDVVDLIAAADVFVLPSRWEGTAGVLLEAMALETPIVTSDLAGVREVVGPHATFVAPEDAHALAAGLIDALADATAATEHTRAARSRFLERFTVERAAAGMREFYDKALSTTRRST